MEKAGLEISENTSKNAHHTVARLLFEENIQTVLDIPSGEEAFTKRLVEKGVEVYAADCENILRISHNNFSVADMNQQLPFADEMFDAVVCIDGIEHIERPFDFIRECRRIIRRGSVLMISTPNLSSLRSRWRWLFTGFPQGEKAPLDEANYTPLHHISLVSFPDLRYRLHANGFKIKTVATNCLKFVSWLYAQLVLLSYIFVRAGFFKDRKRKSTEIQSREILNQSFSVFVHFGETLIVKAVRQ